MLWNFPSVDVYHSKMLMNSIGGRNTEACAFMRQLSLNNCPEMIPLGLYDSHPYCMQL